MPPDLRQAAGTFGNMHGGWGRVFFLKASNATRPIQRDDASIVPYKLLEALQKFRAIPHNSKCRYGERGAAAAGAVLKPSGGNCAVLP